MNRGTTSSDELQGKRECLTWSLPFPAIGCVRSCAVENVYWIDRTQEEGKKINRSRGAGVEPAEISRQWNVREHESKSVEAARDCQVRRDKEEIATKRGIVAVPSCSEQGIEHEVRIRDRGTQEDRSTERV
jgi:hypothetical protein